MSEVAQRVFTPEEYLALERSAEQKSEYYQGEIFAMSGGSLIHSRIAVNITTMLVGALRGKGCQVFNSDLRVHIPANGLYTYPDASVVCGEPQVLDEQRDTIINPVVLVEVLSSTTESYDRGAKFGLYRSIESLREYLLVSQERRWIELFRKNDGGIWELHEPDSSGALELASIGCALRLDDLYADVKLEEKGGLR